MATEGGRQIFITGHSEYDAGTLESEYLRDKNAGLPIHVPENYYPDDDDTKPPMVTWRSHANLLYQNWLNYFVYQTVPYDITRIQSGERTEDCTKTPKEDSFGVSAFYCSCMAVS